MARYIGKDPNGIPRIWAINKNADVAETKAIEKIVLYVKSRPDTGPISKWTIELDIEQ